jgi:hypothetical protein
MSKNNGIRIEIQENLSEEERKESEEFCKKKLEEYIENGYKFKNTCAGWRSFYRRGTVGLRFGKNNNLYFRRASRGRRIYQIVRYEELKPVIENNFYVQKYNLYKYDKCEIEHEKKELKDMCICPSCSAQIKVSNKYGDTKCYLYSEIGIIKG